MSPAVGGELGICKEHSDGIVSKANVTVAQCPNSEQLSNKKIGVNKKRSTIMLCSFLFATSREVAVCGGELGI